MMLFMLDVSPGAPHRRLKATASVLVVAGMIVGTVALKEATVAKPPELSATPAVELKTKDLSDAVEYTDLDNFADNPSGSQLTFVKLSDGTRMGSATERFPRPALSLIKLYLADYVAAHGSEEDRQLAIEMIEGSDDAAAGVLSQTYPEAIGSTAQAYGLRATKAGETWGESTTSTYDVVKFVQIKLEEDPSSPVLEAMRKSHEVANDGYAQNFGTAILPGVTGSKWGWSNEFDLHSSISFSDDFIVAAAVQGSAADLTALVQRHVAPVVSSTGP